VIKVNNIFKSFKEVDVLKNVTFNFEKGAIVGFLGPNGAGKSTLIKIMTGIMSPDKGTIYINNENIAENRNITKSNIGYIPEVPNGFNNLTVKEFLFFCGELRSLKKDIIESELDLIDQQFQIKDIFHKRMDSLSKGLRQRTWLIQALLHNPDLLFLDEPTDGLDPNQKHEVRELIRRMSEERTILVSTHILEEVEAVCTRALIISEGRLVGLGTPDELLSQSIYRNAITLSVSGVNAETLLEDLNGLEQVYSVERLEDMPNGAITVRVFPKDRESISSELEKFLKKKKMSIEQFFVERGRLDEVFRKLTLGN